MVKMMNADLLKDQKVIQEIERHKWFESEKAGFDIGFEKAAEDWLNRYSEKWMQRNLDQPRKLFQSKKRAY